MKLRVPILMYHKIGQPPPGVKFPGLYVPPADLREQFNLLKQSGYKSIGFAELTEALWGKKRIPQRSVIITFDDGFLSVYEQAYPLLEELGFRATVFVVTDFLGKQSHWSENQADLTPEPLLGVKELKEMNNLEIASHTKTHRHLTSLPIKEMHKELIKSKEALQDTFGREIPALCYPYGDYNEEVAQAARKAGYQSACSIRHGNRHSLDDMFCLKRIPVTYGLSLSRFKYRLGLLYDWEYRLKGKRWPAGLTCKSGEISPLKN